MKQVIKENAIIIWLAMNALCGILMLCNKDCTFHPWSLAFFVNCCTIIWRELSFPEKS